MSKMRLSIRAKDAGIETGVPVAEVIVFYPYRGWVVEVGAADAKAKGGCFAMGCKTPGAQVRSGASSLQLEAGSRREH